MCKGHWFQTFTLFLSAKITLRFRIHFFEQKKILFLKKSDVVKKRFSFKSTFSLFEISFENEGYPRPDECFGRTHRGGKSCKVVPSTIIQKTHEFYGIKKQQRSHPEDPGNIFFTEHLKILELLETCFANCSQKSSQLSSRTLSEKKQKRPNVLAKRCDFC